MRYAGCLAMSLSTSLESELPSRLPATNRVAVPVAVAALTATALQTMVSGRQAALFLVGCAAGLVLYHAAFGFTSAWRVFISDRRGAGLRAQMLMLALTCAVFFPVLAAGTFLGAAAAWLGLSGRSRGAGRRVHLRRRHATRRRVRVRARSTRPAAAARGCSSCSRRSSPAPLIGTAHAPWWSRCRRGRQRRSSASGGPWPALAASLAVFGGSQCLTLRMERQRHGGVCAVSSRDGALTGFAGPGRWSPERSVWPRQHRDAR